MHPLGAKCQNVTCGSYNTCRSGGPVNRPGNILLLFSLKFSQWCFFFKQSGNNLQILSRLQFTTKGGNYSTSFESQMLIHWKRQLFSFFGCSNVRFLLKGFCNFTREIFLFIWRWASWNLLVRLLRHFFLVKSFLLVQVTLRRQPCCWYSIPVNIALISLHRLEWSSNYIAP